MNKKWLFITIGIAVLIITGIIVFFLTKQNCSCC